MSAAMQVDGAVSTEHTPSIAQENAGPQQSVPASSSSPSVMKDAMSQPATLSTASWDEPLFQSVFTTLQSGTVVALQKPVGELCFHLVMFA